MIGACAVVIGPGAFRFLDVGDVLAGGGAVKGASDLLAGAAPARPGCCNVAAGIPGDSGLGLRLDGGEDLFQ